MKIMTLKGYFVALLLSLISFSNAGFGKSLPIASGGAPAPANQVWEAVENGTNYKIIKVSNERFLIVYGNKNDISGYVVYDRRNGSTGTEYVPWTSISSNITIGIQETSSQSIGVMLSIDGETTSFVAKPYRPRHKVQNVTHPGKWSAVVSGTSMRLQIAPNLVDMSIDIGKCRLTGKIKSLNQENAYRVAVSQATTVCPTTVGQAFDAALIFSEDLAVVYTTKRESANFIFIGPEANASALNTTPEPRHSSACAQWRAMCRAKCSAMTLPTGDFGFKFWNCVNSCNALAGC
ncbi:MULTISPECIES: hypothetical protein [unclassified Burkholderia]|uniref:hypothetical protein n=1 Tax=unclassified Burkholderia TaxID=2613784 RepID=UPI002AAF86D5|nr:MULTISPECIES: hypothetical protein [unclassified Burkholderia]